MNIQNELVSSGTHTRTKKNRQIQTEVEVQSEIDVSSGDSHRLKRLIEKRCNLVESAIFENNNTNAFHSNKPQKI